MLSLRPRDTAAMPSNPINQFDYASNDIHRFT